MPNVNIKLFRRVFVFNKCSIMVYVVFFLATVYLNNTAYSDAASSPGPLDIFPVEEVEPGLRGEGYTVLKGSSPEKFDFEVLGVLRTFHPQGRVYLIEIDHPEINESGVIAGMSGSPLYIDGKLLGAVAYGFSFALKPIAGVTPAGEMLIPMEIARERAHSSNNNLASRSPARDSLLRDSQIAAASYFEEHGCSKKLRYELIEAFFKAPYADIPRSGRINRNDITGMPSHVKNPFDGASLRMLPMPLSFTGIDIESLGGLASLMHSGGFLPLQAAASGNRAGKDTFHVDSLEPGMPIGVLLMKGDIDIAGMGTLTFIDGDKVAAFGHPMIGAGDTDLPLAVGHVETVMPSRYLSFKLTSSRDVIGSVTQDRASAIVGVLGREAPMFPAEVRISGAYDAVYNYDIAGHWQFAPTMSLYAAALSAMRWDGTLEEMTVHAVSEIKLEGRDEPLIQENTYSGYDPIFPAFDLVLFPIQSLMFNPFEPVEIESLNVEFNVQKGINTAVIEAVQLEKNTVSPGEDLSIWVTLREHHGQTSVKQISLPIPEDAQPGMPVTVYISDASAIMASTFDKDPGLFNPKSLDTLIESLQVLPSNTGLYVSANFVKRGLRYAEEPMPALPGSMRNILQYGTLKGKTSPLIEDVQNSIQTPWVVRGRERLEVKVAK